jgi:hypothetical protein
MHSSGTRSAGGSISVDKIIPLVPERDVIGPMTRSAVDNALIRDVVGAADPNDIWAPIIPILADRRPSPESGFVEALKTSTLQGKTIGIIGTYVGMPHPTPGEGATSNTTNVATTTPATFALVEQAKADMEAAGATVRYVFMPPPVSTAQSDPATAAARLADAERAMSDAYRERYRSDLAAMNLTEADLANDPETYREMLNAGTLPPPTSPDVELMAEAARVIAGRLASGRSGSGTEWANSLENEFLQLQAVKGALAGWSRSEPESAASFVAANYSQSREMLTTVYETWASSDPTRAAAGTGLVKDPVQRAFALESVVSAWAATDAAAAAEWVDRLPEAERTDAVRLAVVSGMSAVDPVEAWNRAQAMTDPSLQYRGLKAAFATIVTRDPQAARGLLESANLSTRNAERLRELLAAVERG